MTSMRRFRISDRGQRVESPGSVAIAVIFVVVANLMLFGVLAAVLLPRSGAGANAEAARAPAVAMAMAPSSRGALAAAAAIAVDALPTPSAALAPPSVAPRLSLVLARSAQRVRRVCPTPDSRRVSVAQQPLTPPESAQHATP